MGAAEVCRLPIVWSSKSLNPTLFRSDTEDRFIHPCLSSLHSAVLENVVYYHFSITTIDPCYPRSLFTAFLLRGIFNKMISKGLVIYANDVKFSTRQNFFNAQPSIEYNGSNALYVVLSYNSYRNEGLRVFA
jgi:hypothetical protein